ncbi:MAG: phosphoribosylanthranilate isomerase [Prevotella sp.]|nr:phosphoribosylanthranilate isomerase [Prevotella sp.]
MIIKVCGMREPENIRALQQLDIDWMGFIFWPESPRFVRMISSRAGIIPDYSSLKEDRASKEEDRPQNRIKRVGVFVDEMPQSIVARVFNYHLNIVQLHGSESKVMIENLRRTLVPDIQPDIQIMKTIAIASADDFKKTEEYEGTVDFFLFDTKCAEMGGSGRTFDWGLISHYQGKTPFLISGGIAPQMAEDIKKFEHPLFYGIDINSQFETEPAVKDIEKIKLFLNALKA